MSTQQLVSSIIEYKRCAILKYCNENGIEKNQLDILSLTNEHNKLGIFIVFTQYLLGIYYFRNFLKFFIC